MYMKKLIFSVLLAAVTTAGNAQVSVDAGYTSDFTIAGTARAKDTAVIGITGAKALGKGFTLYGFNYFLPTNDGRSKSYTDHVGSGHQHVDGVKNALETSSQNHFGVGLAYDVNSLGDFSFTADVQAVYHLVNGPLQDSFQYGIGATFDSLPLISKVASVSVYYMEDIDLEMDGFQIGLSRVFENVLVDNVNLTPKAGVYLFDSFDAYYASLRADYTKYAIRPYVQVSYFDNDLTGDLALDNDVQYTVGLNYSF